MTIFSSGPPADNIQELLVRSFKVHTRGKKGKRPVREQARSLAVEILGAIRWAKSFVPPSKASVNQLGNLLEGWLDLLSDQSPIIVWPCHSLFVDAIAQCAYS